MKRKPRITISPECIGKSNFRSASEQLEYMVARIFKNGMYTHTYETGVQKYLDTAFQKELKIEKEIHESIKESGMVLLEKDL